MLPVANRPIDNRPRAHNGIDCSLQQLPIPAKTYSKPQCLHYFLWLYGCDRHQLFSFLNLSAMKIPMIKNWLPFFLLCLYVRRLCVCLVADLLFIFVGKWAFFAVLRTGNDKFSCGWVNRFYSLFKLVSMILQLVFEHSVFLHSTESKSHITAKQFRVFHSNNPFFGIVFGNLIDSAMICNAKVLA